MHRRRPALLVAAALALGPALAACSGGGPSLGVKGEIAPDGERVPAADLTGQLVTGGSFDLASLHGKVVVLNAFGSWCEPCKTETPAIQAAYEASMGMGVAVVGLDERDVDSEVRTFMQQKGVTYPVVRDDEGKLIAALKQGSALSVLPGTLVLDRKGRVAARYVGPVLYTSLMQTVTALAAEPA